ncbi:hypothetical protein E3C22_08695 [Jiella endophytica]|uniref:Capsule biosynthesis protein n=1 Tax=Jiella endophytica TaxID=2558362 RepID=A0A4Y8RP40_9HYPH|nr:hypothetical protein [Jiella endophytica]TFF25422.1 hypothetical protein E3C22_08695 [Jiella endophytica]
METLGKPLPRVGSALAAIESLDFHRFRRGSEAKQLQNERALAKPDTRREKRSDQRPYAEPGFAAEDRSVGLAPDVSARFPTAFAPNQPPATHGESNPALRRPAEESFELMPDGSGRVRRLDEIATASGSGRKPPWLFLAMVALPVLATFIYLMVFAASQYTSESTYVISRGGAALAGGSLGSLGRSDESSEAIIVFFQSRDAADHLARNADLKAKLMHPSADFLSAYPGLFYHDGNEGLYRAMKDAIEIELNPDTGISTLQVTAFTPEDAREINVAMLNEAEELINRMNDRATKDAIAFAENVVSENENRIREVQKRMTAFRNDESILDPNAQSTTELELMTQLSQQVTQIDTEIAQLRASAPKNPRLNSLAEQRKAVNNQIEKIRSNLAGSDTSLAPKLSAYENLSLERDLAIQALTSAYASLEEARQEAFGNRLYLQTISTPNVPDRPSYPRPIFWTLIVAGMSYALYRIARIAIKEALEHSA